MHYTCDSSLSFDSIVHILMDVNWGWLLRSLHANGASFFFIAIYCHIGRGIYYGSYIYKLVWFTGLILLLTVMGAAFLGYVLPWGQMRFWGATVITNLLSAVPDYGPKLVYWVWGGFSVDNPTLVRFFTLHFLLPFIVSGLSLVHIFFLHITGSNNPFGICSAADKVAFHSYYVSKDVFGFVVFLSFLVLLCIFSPLFFIEADNFIPANPLVTPPHIVPEWYFLFCYAVLRAVPSKLTGVLALICSLVIILWLPFSHSQLMKGLTYYGPLKSYFWSHVCVFILLTWIGSCPVLEPFLSISRILSVLYFLFYVLLGHLRRAWDLFIS